ncbi:type II toxin-antitoxin system Phd/YefM family antitoxin [Thiospirillum jenense]|uniref:type II toxin-antitoxin system Phd/YefM family antitoxin n=1 Tax=Thiospirillum jenense TaxID=1653858 RepID=UPI0030B83629
MNVISYSAVQADLAKTMNRVCDNHEPVIITHDNELAIVMLSLEETAFLLRVVQQMQCVYSLQ